MDYQVGGTLPPNNPHYVEREADNKLFQSLIKDEFCYVFNSRQTGKSSLQVHVRKKLEAEGIICAYIDLSGIDTTSDLESWYLTIIDEIANSLLPEIDIFDWWDEIPNQNLLAKFSKFFNELLLKKFKEKIVIFVDEIDTVLSLNFSTDDFFRFIRSCHNKRALQSEYQRLTFCLLGVTDPSYLIKNKENTPFNIGTAIELKGFNFVEAEKPLTNGLKEQLDNPQQVLQEILNWTNGQPFLTIKILSLLSENNTDSHPNISNFINNHVIKNWESQDHPEHLKTIRDRLFFKKDLLKKILILYQDIIHSQKTNRPIKINNNIDEAQIELLLSGLVVKKNGHLIVNNKTYQSIFSLDWIKEELTKLFSQEKPLWYVGKITQWLNSNRQDKCVLLTPQELINFQIWIGDNKPLNKEDLAFLYQSTKEAERISQQAKEVALRAELKATEEKKKAYKILARLATFTTFIIISSLGFLLHVNKQEKQTQLADKLVQGAQIEYSENIERSLLLYTEALKHQPSISLPLNFYQKLSFLSPLRKILLINQKENNFAENIDNSLNNSSIFCNLKHNHTMSAVAFSSQGNLFATANLDGTIHIWDSSKIFNNFEENNVQKCAYLIKSIKNKSSINVLDFSKDNKSLAIANNDGKIQVLNLDTDQLISLPFSHKSYILSVQFSPDNKYLITGDLQGLVKVWDIDKAQVVTDFQLSSGINDIAFTSEGKLLAIASGNTIYIIPTHSSQTSSYIVNKQIQAIKLDFSILSLQFSPNGKYLAIGSADNTARVLEINKTENKQECISNNCQLISLKEKKIFQHKLKVNVVKFSPDNQSLLTGSDDNSSKLWSVETGNLITQTFHSAPVLEVGFLNPQQIATISWDYTIKIWNDLSQRVVKLIPSKDIWQNIAFNFDNNYLATDNQKNHLQVWNLETASLNSQINLDVSTLENINDLYLSAQGNYLVAINNNRVQIWQKNNHNQWKKIASLVHPDNVHQVIINHQENYLITVCDDRNLRLWNLNQPLKFKQHQIISTNREIENILFTQDDNILVVIDRQAKKQPLSLQQISFIPFKNLDSKTSKYQPKQNKLSPELENIKKVSFARNKPLFVTINKQNNLCIGNITNNKLNQQKCKLMVNHVYDSLLLDANGQYFATVEDGRNLQIWRSQTLKQAIKIPHQDNIKTLVLSEDSQYLATITVKNQLQVWNLKQCKSYLFQSSCQPILNFTEENNIQKIALRKDNNNYYLAIALPNNIIQIRLNNISQLIDREICPLLSRNLTRKEWNKYLDNGSYKFTCL